MDNRWACFTDDQNGYPPGNFNEETLIGLHPANCEGARLSELPDYLNDLNAMYEAENVLSADQLRVYVDCLRRPMMSITYQIWIPAIRATASQRAEAFLKTLNLWIP